SREDGVEAVRDGEEHGQEETMRTEERYGEKRQQKDIKDKQARRGDGRQGDKRKQGLER
ncbi:Uncharacterized protein DAT39_023175, partial [Clarias magur]